MTEASERTRTDTRSFKERSPGKTLLLTLAVFLLLCAIFGIPSYFIAVDRGGVDTWWQYLLCFIAFLVVGCGLSFLVGVRRVRARRRRMTSTATTNLAALVKSHPHSVVAGSLHLRGLGEGLRRLSLPAPSRVSMIAVVAAPTGLGVWSIDSRPKLIATVPAEAVEVVEYRRPKPSAKYLILFAVVKGADAAVDLPLLLTPLAPKYTTEPGRMLVLSLLEESLRRDLPDLPDGFNAYLATDAEVAAIQRAMVRKPALAIEESGVFDERAELR